MGSAIRVLLVTPLLGLLAAVGITVMQATPAHASDRLLVAECNEDGKVVGEIYVSRSGEFDVFVTEHVPGLKDWAEIPGSRQTITVVAGKEGRFVSYGPLDVSALRDSANSIRVESTVSNEKSESFKPCQGQATATPTGTKTPTLTLTFTATATKTATKTPKPSRTSTSRPDTPTRTSTVVVPSATPTFFRTVGPPATVVRKTPVLHPPETGSGGEKDHRGSGHIVSYSVVAGILTIVVTMLGVLTFTIVKPSD